MSCLRGLLATIIVLLALPAWAQRVQFPSAIDPSSPYAGETPPPAVLDGTIQPLDPGWDPYADPSAQPPAMLPQDGYFATQPDGTIGPSERLIQQLGFEYTHVAGNGGDDLQIDDLEASVTAAVPFYYGMAPLLLTPGFAIHFFNGPDSTLFAGSPDLPGQTYDAYLDFGWRPQITPRLSADLGIRPGVYSDFDFVNSESFRIKGRALGIFSASPQIQYVAGVLYLDRLSVKLLPAGGVILTPTDSVRFEILFPRPKFAWRLTTYGNTEWWWYVAAEYGGDTWTIERASGVHDQIDYNDLRVMAGMEFQSFGGYRGYFELGYVFDREVDYRSNLPDFFKPDETLMFRAGFAY